MSKILFISFTTILLSGCAAVSTSWNTAVDKILTPEEVSAKYEKVVAGKIAEAAASAAPEETLSKSLTKDVSQKLAATASETIDGAISNSNTEISITGFEESKPRYEILNVTGFMPSSDGHIQNFVQSSALSSSGRTTVNVGLGRRYLSADEKFITGVNAFLDYDVEYGHQRMSVGGELKSSTLEFTANSYHGITSWKTGKDDNSERALSGYDVEVGAQIPFIPSAKFYLKRFEWDMYDATDIKGTDYSLAFSHILSSGVGLEIGRRNYSGAQTDENFALFNYKVPLGANKDVTELPLFSSRMFENKSMKPKMLDKVRRNNAIVVQTKFTSSVGGV